MYVRCARSYFKVLAFVVPLIACKNTSPGTKHEETVGPATSSDSSNSTEFGIKDGLPAFDSTNVMVMSGLSVGSGTFVKRRCVLTANHVMADGLTSVYQQSDLPNSLGLSAKLVRLERLPDQFTPKSTCDSMNCDMALIWVAREKPALTGIKNLYIDHDYGYTPKAISYADQSNAGNKTLYSVFGYGNNALDQNGIPIGAGTQRIGTFYWNKMSSPVPSNGQGAAVSGSNTNLYYTGNGTFGTMPGDSGAPVLLDNKVVAVHTGTASALLWSSSQGSATAAFMPWLKDRLALFCEPWFKIQISADTTLGGKFINVTATAQTTTMNNEQIIDCNTGITSKCSRGLTADMTTVAGRNDILAGVGTVTLVAADRPDSCFLNWWMSQGCQCIGSSPNSSYYSNKTCTIALSEMGTVDAQGSSIGNEGKTVFCNAQYAPKTSMYCKK